MITIRLTVSQHFTTKENRYLGHEPVPFSIDSLFQNGHRLFILNRYGKISGRDLAISLVFHFTTVTAH